MEESKDVNKRFEFLLRSIIELLIVQFGETLLDILGKSIGWFSDNLKTLLEDAERELVSGRGRQPQSEALVGSAWLGDVLDDCLERLEPGSEQVAVLKHYPVSSHDSLLNQLLSNSSHTLTKSLESELTHT